MKPAPGVQVTSKIELVSPIAEGAMGSVWVAYHHRLQSRVAVKFVSDKLGEDTAEALARFEREAATAAQIKSAHVIQTYDSGLTPEGVPYMVMELLEGESLGDRLRRAGHIDLHDAAIVLTQVARALTKAHQLGIIHRDIKPDNIYLCSGEDGIFCKVLDFGIAKQTRLPQMGGLTHEGKMVGTPEYLSPEQVLEGHAADYRADLWALAVVMYASISGYLPFTGKTLGQMCLALASGLHAPPSSIRQTLPTSLDGWFARALHRNPDERFASAREMALSFLAALPDSDQSGVDLSAGTLFSRHTDDTERQFVSSHTTVTPPSNKRGAAAVLATVAIVGLVGLSAGGIMLSTSSASSPAVAGVNDEMVRLAAEATAVAIVVDLDEPGDDAPATSGAEPDETDEGPDQPTADLIGSSKPKATPVTPAIKQPEPVDRARVEKPGVGKPGVEKPGVEKPGVEKPEPEDPPPVTQPADGRRGKDDLGF